MKMLERGDIDMVLTIYHNEKRAEFAYFTEAYRDTESAIFVRKGQEQNYQSWDDLKGRKGVRFQGTSVGQKFDQFAKEHLNVFDVNDQASMLKMVATGRVDYGFAKRLDIKIKIAENRLTKQVVLLPSPISKIPLRFAISKRSSLAQHIATINQQIAKFRASGWIEKIIDESLPAVP